MIFRTFFEGLVKINTHGRPVRYVLFYIATSKIISKYNAFLWKITGFYEFFASSLVLENDYFEMLEIAEVLE